MQRQYVHLSTNNETAKVIANRKGKNNIVLQIFAEDAYYENITFYKENEELWLADHIPSKYIHYDEIN